MNNSSLTIEVEEVDNTSILQEKMASHVKTIEALERVAQSSDWKILKEQMFDGVIESLERRLRSESLKKEIDSSVLYSLQGQIVWARRYADLESLSDAFKVELKEIKKQLHGKTKKRSS